MYANNLFIIISINYKGRALMSLMKLILTYKLQELISSRLKYN